MYYFDKVTFTTNVIRKNVCVDISLFKCNFLLRMHNSVGSYSDRSK